MKKDMSLEGLRWSCDSGSALYDTPPNGRSRTGWGGESKFPKEDEEILPPVELFADYFKKRKALDHEILRDTSDSIYHSFLMKKYDFVLFNERNEEKQLLLILAHIQNLRN